MVYGWSKWLALTNPVTARYVRFDWDDNYDRLHEVELFFAPAAAVPVPEYEIVNLSELIASGPATSTATAINSRGAVVGWYKHPSSGENRAVFWDLNLAGHALAFDLATCTTPICPITDNYAYDVNDHDEVVGYETTSFFTPSARRWQALTGQSRSLPGQHSYSASYAINNESNIAGYEYELFGGGSAAYRLHWDAPDRDGILIDTAVAYSVGRDVNDLGDTVGRYNDPSQGSWEAFFYRGSETSEQLPETLPRPSGMTEGDARAVSNSRLIVGGVSDSSGSEKPVLWRWDGQWTVELLAVQPGSDGFALGINDVGYAVGHQDGSTAMLWHEGQALDLNNLIPPQAQADWQLTEARDINDRGEIVGEGLFQGQPTAFLLRPVRSFDLQALPGAEAINDRGWIAGNAGSGPTAAWVLPAAATCPLSYGLATWAHDLGDQGTLAGFEGTAGAAVWEEGPWGLVDLPAASVGSPLQTLGVSASGHAVGHRGSGTQSMALFWDETGTAFEPFAFDSFLSAVNTSGHAAGSKVVNPGGYHPYRWSGRDGQQLLSYTAHSETWDIDSRGFIAGLQGGTLTSGQLWDLAGVAHDLGRLETDINGSNVGARAINDRRQIVGYHAPRNSALADHAAFLWEQGAMIDLNLLLPPGTPWRLISAHDVNDAGQILGEGHTPPTATQRTDFVLTLSNEAEDVIRLCRGWCQPLLECGEGSWDIWTRPNYADAFGACVNGCIAYAMDPNRPHSLEEEYAVRDCFLDAEGELCSEDWRERTQQCCDGLGLSDCEVYY